MKYKHKSTIFCFIVAQYLSMFVNKIKNVCVPKRNSIDFTSIVVGLCMSLYINCCGCHLTIITLLPVFH
jgi:hypothetical protein